MIERFVDKWDGEGEKAVAGDLVPARLRHRRHAVRGERSGDEQRRERGRLRDDDQGHVLAAGEPAVHRVRQGDQGARSAARLHQEAVATKDGKGSALGVLKAARGPDGEQLSAAELEIELLHFFFAAHGGLTAALAWVLVVLGEHPELAARLRAEADAMLGEASPTLAQVERSGTRARCRARCCARIRSRR